MPRRILTLSKQKKEQIYQAVIEDLVLEDPAKRAIFLEHCTLQEVEFALALIKVQELSYDNVSGLSFELPEQKIRVAELLVVNPEIFTDGSNVAQILRNALGDNYSETPYATLPDSHSYKKGSSFLSWMFGNQQVPPAKPVQEIPIAQEAAEDNPNRTEEQSVQKPRPDIR